MPSTRSLKLSVSTAALILLAAPSMAHSLDTILKGLNPADLGQVAFATSCNDDAQPVFETGLLLLIT